MIDLDPETRIAAIKALKEWSKQFQTKPDYERVTIKVGDLKMFTKGCLALLEFQNGDGGGEGCTIIPLRLVEKLHKQCI